MLTINSDEELDKTLGRYLINVLNIPQPWSEKKTLKQKDEERKQLHDKLVELLKIEDRDIVSKCTEATWPVYTKFGDLRKAKNAFYHELNKLTGQNPMTQEQESKLAELYQGFEGGSSSKIKQNLMDYFKKVRRPYYQGIFAKYVEEYEKKTSDELHEMLKKVPEKYLEYYKEMDRRSSEWFKWFNQSNLEYGNGFSSSYYDMEWYYYCFDFYHDYRMRVSVVVDGLKKWKDCPEVTKWAAKTLATFQTWFDGVEEYLNTPYEKLAEIYLSFKNGDAQ